MACKYRVVGYESFGLFILVSVYPYTHIKHFIIPSPFGFLSIPTVSMLLPPIFRYILAIIPPSCGIVT